VKKIILVLASVLLLSSASLAFSQPGPGGPPLGGQKFLESAGLTADQVTQVTDLFDKFRASVKTQRAAIAVFDAQIRQIMVSATPDLGAANALVDKKTALRADIEKQRLTTEVQIHKIVGDKAFDKLQGMFGHRFPGGMRLRGTSRKVPVPAPQVDKESRRRL